MCNNSLRKISTTTQTHISPTVPVGKLLLFTSQVLLFCALCFHSSAADAPPPPPGLHHHRRDERPVPKYKYSYTVRGAEGGQHGHQFYRDGSYTQGKYFVKLNGGSGQNVEYYTDRFGYHPKVIYMNHGATGSSGARIFYGRAVTPFETSSSINHTTTETPIKPENQSSTTTQQNSTTYETIAPSTESTLHYTATTASSPSFASHITQDSAPYRVKISSTTPSEGQSFEYASTSPTYPNEYIIRDTVYNQPQTIDAIAPIILAQNPSHDDTYLQPELNEISSTFAGNIVSMLPGIIAARTKLLKPIIVSNSSNTKREASSGDNVTKEIDGSRPDLTVESAQHEEYHELPDEQIISTDNENDTVVETHSKSGEIDIKKPQVDVVIEPQMLEEQAVITTTVDIAKSLPLAVNFVPETDNHLNDVPINYIPTHQPQIVLPQHNVYLQQPVALQLPQAILKPDNIPQPYLLPNSEFHYIPIPVLQHQPNVIPLNYANDTRTLPTDTVESIRPSPEHQQQQTQETVPKTDYSFIKSIEDYSGGNNIQYNKPFDLPRKPHIKPHYLQHIDQRRPPVLPYTTINLPAAQLIPYVKHNFIESSPGGHHLAPQQKSHSPMASPKSHNIPYNMLKSYNKEKRTPQPQKAPFKPSHPVWDSVYPPSHMYYIPMYVVDQVPGDHRNPKDSFSRRHNHLRRLYVEYGGFKPPLVPSTLIETEEPAQEKRDVPKEAAAAGTES